MDFDDRKASEMRYLSIMCKNNDMMARGTSAQKWTVYTHRNCGGIKHALVDVVGLSDGQN